MLILVFKLLVVEHQTTLLLLQLSQNIALPLNSGSIHNRLQLGVLILSCPHPRTLGARALNGMLLGRQANVVVVGIHGAVGICLPRRFIASKNDLGLRNRDHNGLVGGRGSWLLMIHLELVDLLLEH